MNPVYRSPTQEDIEHVAAHMRDSDVLEVAASGGRTPLLALVDSVTESTISMTAVFDGIPVAIFGFVYDEVSNKAGVWMLCTTDVYRHRQTFFKESVRILTGWLPLADELYNFVAVDNTLTRRWLREVGFAEGDPMPYGPMGQSFVRVSYNDV